MNDTSAGTPDPITLEVMKHEFISVVDEMTAVVGRTVRSFVARDGGDFNGVLATADGRMVARSGINTWYVPNSLPSIIEKFGDTLQPGDVVVTNDPFAGGTHLLDLIVVAPVFLGGELVAFVGTALHHTDLAGRAAGGMSPTSTELYEEGLLLPRVKLYDAGRLVPSVAEVIVANTRAPQDVAGDLEGQVSGCWAGVRGVTRLCEKHGVETFRVYGEHLIAYTEREVRRAIACIPAGTYRAEAPIDSYGDDEPVFVRLAVTRQGDELVLDFGGTDPQTRNAINLPPSTLAGNLLRFFHHLFEIDVPDNAGLFVPMTIKAPEGSVVNPRYPAAVGARSAVATRLSSLLFAALAQAVPERVPADALIASIMTYTPDPEEGAAPGVVFDLWAGSTGGRPRLDGIDGPARLGRRIPGEVMEREAPIVLAGHGLVPDTGGPGRHRGGLATFRQWRFLRPGRLYVRNLGAHSPAYGLAGGGFGSRSQVLVTAGGTVTDYSDESVVEIRVDAGDTLLHVSGGAGGHGDPLSRDPAAVAADVLDGRVTAAHAADVYGVAIDGDTGAIDKGETARLRGVQADP